MIRKIQDLKWVIKYMKNSLKLILEELQLKVLSKLSVLELGKQKKIDSMKTS